MSAEKLLQHHEGFRSQPYLCSEGRLTIGFGRNIQDRGISKAEAAYLLRNDIAEAVSHLRLERYWLDLSEVRQAVLIDMVVNMGWTRFAEFRKLRAALADDDYVKAASEMMDSKWWTQVKTRGPRLRDMMLKNRWPDDVPGIGGGYE